MSPGPSQFAAEFRAARERRGWSYRTAEKKLEISTKTIQNWQNGDHPAQLLKHRKVMLAVAQMMEVSPQELVAMLEVLPTHNLDTLEDRSDAPGVPVLQQRLQLSRPALFSAMSLVTDSYPDWLRLERLASRGQLTRVRFHTLLGLQPNPRDVDKFGGPDGIKSHLMGGVLRSIWTQAGMHWRSGNPPGWESPPELLIQIPIQERTRPIPEPRNRLSDDLQIFCVGLPWLHAELLASFVADALAFGYVDLRYTSRLIGITHTDLDPSEGVGQALRWIRPGYVVSLSSPADAQAHETLLRTVADRSVVVVCTSDPLMEVVGRWVYGYQDEHAHALKTLIRDLRECHSRVIEVHFSDDDFADLHFSGDSVQQELSDRACDLSLAAAVDVVKLLAARYPYVPSPDKWTGHLSDVVDKRGRINWEKKVATDIKWIS